MIKNRALIGLVSALGMLAIAGCGSSARSATPATSSATTVMVRDIGGVGNTLVDSSGGALYFADQETNGTITCVDACVRFWHPLTVSAGSTPTSSVSLSGKLATLQRPDGAIQVTYNGRALYTFADDGGPGHANGNGFADAFNGHNFVWHAATTSGAAPATTPATNGYGY